MEIGNAWTEIVFADLFRITMIIAILLFFFFFEFYFPAEKRQSIQGKARNIGYMLMFLFLGGVLFSALHAYIPIEHTNSTLDSPLLSLFSVLLYILVGDFIYYWYHRAQHSWHWLWQIHELHHSDEELNATTSMRTYFLERPVQYLVIALPMFYVVSLTPLGEIVVLDSLALTLLTVIYAFWLFFTHANLKLSFGPLTKVFTGPQLHRVHHSTQDKHRDTNFAQFFPIWDILFGTYVHPEKSEYPKTGTPELESNASFAKSTFKPFKTWFGLSK